ncbi:LOW QUALITY PROTEIN: transcription elongation factor, mitochondrial [Dromiciops gliroides]|uniref:LOW QUALITY PROTEIN: transcription elongation factor, mitochondrial n=1 Tax=Dromiciops gliroides TaxID=33562 RepID=UPI001CC78FC6|nr:LOW QUALITY PROTEIN: transcription elongation factor, mitochondrial [Dromiciops gliroides]
MPEPGRQGALERLLVHSFSPEPVLKWKYFQVALCPSLYQPLLSCCQRKSIAPVKKIDFVSSSSDESFKDTAKVLEGLYSSEEKAAILQVLNTASVDELAAFTFLRGRKSVNIVKHREKHGLFQDLESLMEVPLFQYKTIVKVCDSILQPEWKRKKREKRTTENWVLGKVTKPGVEKKKLKAANSIVSIVFGKEKIAWAHLDNKLTVLDWQQGNSFKQMKETYVSSVYLERISSIVSEILKRFLRLEKRTFSLQQTTLFPVALHFHIVEAHAVFLVKQTFAQDGHHRVLSMSRNVVGKHFDLMLGTMRTSGMDVVQQLLTDSVMKAEPRVFFPPERVIRYRSMMETNGRERKEELWDSLLQAVAFYELLVFDPQT